jgi:hypothetical protein
LGLIYRKLYLAWLRLALFSFIVKAWPNLSSALSGLDKHVLIYPEHLLGLAKPGLIYPKHF